MSGSDMANLIIVAVYLPVQLFMCVRIGHYMRTGRWFR
jgi:hypothetical protein